MKKVLVGGCFDLIHYGHIVFLNEAKKKGDYLVVALESDENIKKYKGADRPIHTQKERAEMLESMKMVDEIIELPEMKNNNDYFNLVQKVKPSVIAVTENDPQLLNKKKQAELIGAKVIVVTKRINSLSTSRFKKRYYL